MQQHRLLIGAEFADLIEEEQTAIGCTEQPGAVALRAGEGAPHMAEERACRSVAAERGAVHFDESAGELMPLLLQLEDTARQGGFARRQWVP
jgi:hypothetical protein